MKKIITRVRNDFITGIAILLPIVITIIVLDFVIQALNRQLLSPLIKMINPLMTGAYVTIAAKMLILFVILIGVTLIGVAGRTLFVRRFFAFWERLLFKVPMVSKIYGGTKQLSRAFLGQGKAIFKGVALIEYPRKGVYSIAFITKMTTKVEITEKAGRDLVSLFLPTTPNPTSGLFIAMPKEDVIFLDMTIEDGFKLIISAGAI